MRSRFTVARRKKRGEPAEQAVALGIDLGMRWTKLAKHIAGVGCQPCSLGDKELAIDPGGEGQGLRGVTETVGAGAKGARNFKPFLGSRVHTLDTNEKVEEVVQRFIQSVLVDWLSTEGTIQVSRAAATYPVTFPMLGRLLLARCVQHALSAVGCGESSQVTHMLPEPVAVIVAQEEYRNLPSREERTIVVYDLGGATFDAALVGLVGGDDGTHFAIRATTGLKECGSYYFDEKIKAAFGLPKGVAIERERVRLSRELRELMNDVSDSELRGIEADKSIEILGRCIRAADIRQLLTEHIEQTADSMMNMLAAEGLRWEDVDVVLLNGGGSLLWFVPDVLNRVVPNVRVKWAKDPIRDVAKGAAYVAGSQSFVEAHVPFADDILLEVPGASGGPRYHVVFKHGEYPPTEGVRLQVHSHAKATATFALRERVKNTPIAAFRADLQHYTDPGELLQLRFTVDSPACAQLYRGIGIKGALLVALEAANASGNSVPITPVVDVEKLSAAESSGWTLEQPSLRVEIALLLDATESARSAELHDALVQAIESACHAFVRAHQLSQPSIAVRVIFYGDGRLRERSRPQKPCPFPLLREVMRSTPRYIGGDADETPGDALERLAEAWGDAPDQWTVRVAILCSDADDAELSAASWEQNAPRLQRLTELLERTGGALWVIGQPRGWLERWLQSLGQKPEVIPPGSSPWLKGQLFRVLETVYADFKRR